MAGDHSAVAEPTADTSHLDALIRAAEDAADRGDTSVGIDLASDAAKLAEGIGDRRRQAAALTLIGRQRRRLGECEAAVAAYEQGIQLMYAAGDDNAVAVALTDQAMAYNDLGLHDEALRGLSTSREIAQRTGDQELLYWSYNRIGAVHGSMGDHLQADIFLRHALGIAHVVPTSDQFAVLNNIGDNTIGLVFQLRERGEPEAADVALRFGLKQTARGLQLARDAEHPFRESMCADIYGMLLGMAGDYEAAHKAIEHSRQIAAASGYQSLELSAVLHSASVQMLRGDIADAAQRLERILAPADTTEDREFLVKLHQMVSEAHEKLGDYKKALYHYKLYHQLHSEATTEKAATRGRLLNNHFELDNARLEAELHRIRSQELEADKQALELRANELDRRVREDALTGLSNRRDVETRLPDLYQTAIGRNRQLCIAVADVDRFKDINDTFGHPVGDEVLRRLAAVLRTQSRQVDLVARLGGEEFLIAFPEMSLDEARQACDRLRVSVAEQPWHTIDPALRVTVSFGLSDIGGSTSHDEVLARADARLYDAKRNGRNRVEPATDSLQSAA